MQFVYTRTDPGLMEAVAYANTLDADEAFWAKIAQHPQFEYTDLGSAEICSRLRACKDPVEVVHFTGTLLRPRRSTVAVTDPNKRFWVAYHTRFFGNSVASKVNTLVHEFVHNVDFFGDGNRQLEYTHTEDPTPTRPMTAPYRIGWLAQKHYEAAQPSGLIRKGADLVLDAFDDDIGEVSDEELA